MKIYMVRSQSPSLGGIRNSSTALALLYLTHKWYEVMDTPNIIIRIVFLDFKKGFDLIDHNVLLENMKSIGVRMSLIKLNERSHYTEFKTSGDRFRVITEGVPQGRKIGPTAFVIKINNLPVVLKEEMVRTMATNSEAWVVIDDDTIMFMDDITLYESLEVSTHISGMPIGGLSEKFNLVVIFTEDERMALNLEKFKEMVIDFGKK